MKLLNGYQAIIDPRKVTDYYLSPPTTTANTRRGYFRTCLV